MLLAGDATANLMWRLQNGELRKGLKAGVVVLHIGSSDLTYASFQVALQSPDCLHRCSHVQACLQLHGVKTRVTLSLARARMLLRDYFDGHCEHWLRHHQDGLSHRGRVQLHAARAAAWAS